MHVYPMGVRLVNYQTLSLCFLFISLHLLFISFKFFFCSFYFFSALLFDFFRISFYFPFILVALMSPNIFGRGPRRVAYLPPSLPFPPPGVSNLTPLNKKSIPIVNNPALLGE